LEGDRHREGDILMGLTILESGILSFTHSTPNHQQNTKKCKCFLILPFVFLPHMYMMMMMPKV
jgi:hypothetical protein